MPASRSSRILGQPFLKIGAILFCLALIFVRAPVLFLSGRFWAEEGAVYFYEACTQSVLDTLLLTQLGYYSLLNKLACLTAAYLVPLQYAPVVTGLLAGLIQALPCILLVCSRVPAMEQLHVRILAGLLALLVQPNQEVWVNTINSQFFLCIAVSVILISEPLGTAMHIVRLGVLVLAGLTGAPSVFVWPFFVIYYATCPSKAKLHEMLALGAAGAIQIFLILCEPLREMSCHWHILPFAMCVKQWILPFFGTWVAQKAADAIIADNLMNYKACIIPAILPYAVFFVNLLVCGRKEALLLFLCLLLVAVMSFVGSLDSGSADRIALHITPTFGCRYYFAPNVMLGFALLIPPRPDCRRPLWAKRYGAIRLVLVAMMFITGGIDFARTGEHQWFFSGPTWSSEVEAWEQGKKNRLDIWPRPWSMKAPKPAIK